MTSADPVPSLAACAVRRVLATGHGRRPVLLHTTGPRTEKRPRLVRERTAILPYSETAGASDWSTEAVKGLIKAMCRVAPGSRRFENDRLRALLAVDECR